MTSENVIEMGTVRCTVLLEAEAPVPAGVLFPELQPDEILRRTGAAPEQQLPGVITALLVETAGRLVLVDAGLGPSAGGGVHERLAELEIDPGAVEAVVISHAHPDHVGGVLLDGGPAFPNARHVVHEAEVVFWLDPAWEGSETGPFRLPVHIAAPARQVLPALEAAGLLEVVDREASVVPGVRVVPAPGHTPGHVAVAVAGGIDELLWAADAFVHVANVADPWPASRMDTERDRTVATRRSLLERAVQRRSTLAAAHFRDRGRVVRDGNGFRLEPGGLQEGERSRGVSG